jgi:histidine decarboxylase
MSVERKPVKRSFSINPFLGTQEILDEFKQHLKERAKHHIGLPYNLDFDHQPLGEFLQFSINNLGDPFVQSNYGVHSRAFEVQVLAYFAHLWKIPLKEHWGYVTTCGAEGNMYGILLGRECLPKGILYTSAESHHSIFKAAVFYRMDIKTIPTQINGEMDYAAFDKVVSENKDRPAIINLNLGTTQYGSIDNVDKVVDILKKNGFNRDDWFIHCDGELFSMLLPYVANQVTQCNFEKPINSISISGHKFLGSNMPCGVVITYNKLVKKLEQHIAYLNSIDTTITGSRNGQAALALWYSLREKGKLVYTQEVQKCLENSNYLVDLLKKNHISAFSYPYSNAVLFEKPQVMDFIKKWQLSIRDTVAIAYIMPNIGRDKIEKFVEEFVESRMNDIGEQVCIKSQVPKGECMCKSCGKTIKSKL